MSSEEILEFWFGRDVAGGSWQDCREKWFSGGAELDGEISRRFGAALESASSGSLDHWAREPRGGLALVILLDQFSRNIHRATAAAFGNDAKALSLALAAVRDGVDHAYHPIERMFLYMPFQHSEDTAVQEQGLALFRTLAEEPGDAQELLGKTVESAEKHLALIRRFGRFPHRNALIGRESSPEEESYLAEGGDSFGQSPPRK